MMKKFSPMIVFLLTIPAVVFAQGAGDPIKIGIINLNKVMLSSEIGKASYTRIQEFRQSEENTLKQEYEQLLSDANQLENKRAILTADAYESQRNDLQKKQLDWNQRSNAYKRELEKINNEELQKFIKVALPIINDVGKEQGFSLLLDPSAQGSQLLYFDESYDITDLIIKRINDATKAQESSSGEGN